MYHVEISAEVAEWLDSAAEKDERIVRSNLKKLADDPRPGRGKGDKERLTVDGVEMCRMHIGRTWTAFYVIGDDDETVRVLEVTSIDDAHKRYGH